MTPETYTVPTGPASGRAGYRPAFVASIPGALEILLLALPFAAVLLTGCGQSDGASKSAPPPNVQTVRVRQGEIIRTLTLPGNVRAYQEATLYAKIAGYLKSIAVDKGDWVKANDVLAEIEAPEMLADLGKVKVELAVAEVDAKRVQQAVAKAPDLVMPQTADTARGKYEIAKANLERIQTLLGYSKIVAPFDGVITRRWVDPGAFIPSATSGSAAKNAAVVTLMDFRRARVEVAVPQSDASLVKTGLPVRVSIEDLPGRTFEGEVTRFAYALDESTKTMMTEIEIPNPERALRPGMYANCHIALEKKTDALLLPAEALVTEKKKNFVFCFRDGKAARVPVKIGFDDGVSVEILEGLKPNESVIAAGKQAIADGQSVNAREVK
ncbi:MAG: efflux RND transporter periplasmic adaptor subunit [Verrucomicrobia subdivision 3 bacterium]|nr:efflux RND transporter periplasmic adaptor subunit [Limisphaerales bacterium]